MPTPGAPAHRMCPLARAPLPPGGPRHRRTGSPIHDRPRRAPRAKLKLDAKTVDVQPGDRICMPSPPSPPIRRSLAAALLAARSRPGRCTLAGSGPAASPDGDVGVARASVRPGEVPRQPRVGSPHSAATAPPETQRAEGQPFTPTPRRLPRSAEAGHAGPRAATATQRSPVSAPARPSRPLHRRLTFRQEPTPIRAV